MRRLAMAAGTILIAGFVAGCAGAAPAARAPSESAGAVPRAKSLGESEDELAGRVREVVVAQRGRLRACYEGGLAQDPALAGRVVLVVEVGQDGMASHVYEAHREGLGVAEVKCFARVLKSTRFHDGAASPVKIQVPLSFSPSQD